MQKPVGNEISGYAYNQAQQQAMPDDGALALQDLLATVWSGKWTILFVTCLFFVLGIVMSSGTKTFSYVTEAIVLKDESASPLQSLGLPGQTPITSSRFNDQSSEVEVLRSRVLAEKVFAKLNLIDDPLYNYTLVEPEKPFYQPVLDWYGYEAPEQTAPSPLFVYEAALAKMKSQIVITNSEFSSVFRIGLNAQTADHAANIANTLAEVYIQDQIDANFRKNEAAIVWLTNRVVELKAQLEDSEGAVSDFDGQTDLISEEDLAAVTRQIKGLRDRIVAVNEDILRMAKKVDNLNIANATGDIVEMAKAGDESFLLNLAEQVANGTSGAATKFREEFLRIERQSKLQVVRLESQLNGLEKTLGNLESQIGSQSTDLIRMRQLQREAESAGIIYSFYQGRLNELAVSQGTKQADSRVLAQAVPPFAPIVRSGYTSYLMLLIGLFFSTVYVVARDLMNKTIRTPDELEKAVSGTAVLGNLPLAPFRRRGKFIPYLQANGTSEFSESVRNIRTSLMLVNDGKAPQVIMATSTDPGEGKTTTSVGLAVHFAKLGKRTLIVECDIRRRVFNSYFRKNPTHGISSVIMGTSTLEDVVQPSEQENLSVIFGDKSDQNAADLFSHHGFDTFLDNAREQYDVIILDVPPVLAVTDARIIAQVSDAVLYIVHWNKTPKSKVRRGMASLTEFGVDVSGVILSKVNTRNSRYNYYSGSNYKYYR